MNFLTHSWQESFDGPSCFGLGAVPLHLSMNLHVPISLLYFVVLFGPVVGIFVVEKFDLVVAQGGGDLVATLVFCEAVGVVSLVVGGTKTLVFGNNNLFFVVLDFLGLPIQMCSFSFVACLASLDLELYVLVFISCCIPSHFVGFSALLPYSMGLLGAFDPWGLACLLGFFFRVACVPVVSDFGGSSARVWSLLWWL